jgi:hypothetical protein
MPLIVQQIRSHWRGYAILFLGLLAAAALLAGLPLFVAGIAGRSLEQRLLDAPVAARNLLVSGPALSDDAYAQLAATLGPVVGRRVEVRNVRMPALPALYGPDGERPFDEYLALHAFAFSDLAGAVEVIDGRLPADSGEEEVIEAVVGQEALADPNFTRAGGATVALDNVRIGDELQADNGRVRFRIVGVVAPREPDADAWYGTLLPFGFLRQALNGASLPETVTLSLLVPPESLVTYFPAHIYQWRLLTNPAAVGADPEAAEAALREAETRLAGAGLQIDSSLLEIIGGYRDELTAARGALVLLATQAGLFALLVLGMAGGLLAAGSRQEQETLIGRGVSTGDLVRAFSLATLPLALLAALLAPPAGRVALGLSASADGLVIPTEAWLPGMGGALAGWLAVVVAFTLRTRAQRRAPAGDRAHPPDRPMWQRLYFDVILVVFGALAVRQASAGAALPVNLPALGGADPLLLLGPTLLLLGAALLATRLYPAVLRLLAGRSGGRGLAGLYGLAHLGRDAADGRRLFLTVALATGLFVFAGVWSQTVANQQEAMALYRAGADLRVSLPIEAGPAETGQLAALDGVAAASPVYWNERVRWATEQARLVTLAAVDPETFGAVAAYAPGTSTLTLSDVLPPLTQPSERGVPAVLSYDAFPPDVQVGDVVSYIVGTRPVDFEVRGLIRAFPAAGTPFLITNLGLLEARVDLTTFSEPWVGRREVWLKARPGQAPAVAAAIENGEGPAESRVGATAAAVQSELRADLIGRQTLGAMSVYSLATLAFVLAFVTAAAYASARARANEFDLLRVLGLSARGTTGLMAREAAVVLLPALLAGCGLGFALAWLMRPLLGPFVAAAAGGIAIDQIMPDWPALLLSLALLSLATCAAWSAGFWLARRKGESGAGFRGVYGVNG